MGFNSGFKGLSHVITGSLVYCIIHNSNWRC